MADDVTGIVAAVRAAAENPVASYTTGILSTLGILALASRWFRKDKFDATLDEKAKALIDTYGDRLDRVEKAREADQLIIAEQQRKIAELEGTLSSLVNENRRLRDENEGLHNDLNARTTELRALQLSFGAQASTIEALQLKVRNLEKQANGSMAGGKRATDPK